MADVFSSAFELFGHCHRGYNSSKYMTDEDIDQLGKNNNLLVDSCLMNANVINLEEQIITFLKFYRQNFPNASILPKMHIMEDHVVPLLQRWRLGSGLMGEQGAESIHAHLMKLERVHQGIPDEVDRWKYIMKEHMLESHPSLTCLRPPPEKRKCPEDSNSGGSDNDSSI